MQNQHPHGFLQFARVLMYDSIFGKKGGVRFLREFILTGSLDMRFSTFTSISEPYEKLPCNS